MRSKEYIRKNYRHFSEFIAVAAARELEYMVLDARYTSGFSRRMKEIFSDLKGRSNLIAEFSVLFNTNGDIAVIDADIVGNYIADRYSVMMEKFYKVDSLNRIAKSAAGGNEKVQKDFLSITYEVLYQTLTEIYMEIMCKRDFVNITRLRFNITGYNREDISAVIAVILIVEDICKYMEINENILMKVIDAKLLK